MAVRVTCGCGTTYDLRDEFAGRLVRCPQCGRESRAPSAASAAARPQADPVFDRDLFLLRQQLMRISATYEVADEQGKKIVFIQRPAHLLQNLGALLAAFVVFSVVAGVIVAVTGQMKGSGAGDALSTLGVLAAIIAGLAVGIALSAKRHVTFFRDESKRERLLEVLQDRKWQPITSTYTVRDARGRPLAYLGKNWLYNLFRKRWYVYGPDHALAYVAKEDSVILSLLRRFLGPFFGLLRTNFIILRAGTEDVLGEFKRKFTILDRYVLDMSADPQRLMDRRVALALGVMLDTGERR
ncbi:MAG: hypothetical protein ACREMV_14765 [Gemmatimonadales bacterium]